MTDMVNVYEAKTHLSHLIARVEAGEEITLSRNGHPVARIVPLNAPRRTREPGAWKGRVVIHEGFDEFTDQDARDWYGE
jgi:prevent-host-death family protein